MMEAGKEALDSISECDPSVSASVYYVSSQYHKLQKHFAEFFRSSMMYLAFVSSDSMAADFKLALAVDVALAALLGEDVYSFAQLLTHPISKALENSQFAWLHEMLVAFNSGNLHRCVTGRLVCLPYCISSEAQLIGGRFCTPFRC